MPELMGIHGPRDRLNASLMDHLADPASVNLLD
jgi:hypothetical protein